MNSSCFPLGAVELKVALAMSLGGDFKPLEGGIMTHLVSEQSESGYNKLCPPLLLEEEKSLMQEAENLP